MPANVTFAKVGLNDWVGWHCGSSGCIEISETGEQLGSVNIKRNVITFPNIPISIYFTPTSALIVPCSIHQSNYRSFYIWLITKQSTKYLFFHYPVLV